MSLQQIYPGTNHIVPSEISTVNLEIARDVHEPLELVWTQYDSKDTPIAGLYIAIKQLIEEVRDDSRFPTLHGALIWFTPNYEQYLDSLWHNSAMAYLQEVTSSIGRRLIDFYTIRPVRDAALVLPNTSFRAATLEINSINGINKQAVESGFQSFRRRNNL